MGVCVCERERERKWEMGNGEWETISYQIIDECLHCLLILFEGIFFAFLKNCLFVFFKGSKKMLLSLFDGINTAHRNSK